MKEETNPGSVARLGYITSTSVPRDVAGRPGPAGDNGQGGAVCPSWRLKVASLPFLIHPRFRLFATFPGRDFGVPTFHSRSYTLPLSSSHTLISSTKPQFLPLQPSLAVPDLPKFLVPTFLFGPAIFSLSFIPPKLREPPLDLS